jgi:hypothetical protein
LQSRFRHFIIVILILFCSNSFAQNNIEIFADVKDNDTLQKLVNIFTGQLKKSLPDNFTVQNTSSYTGKGIYICNTTASQKVKPSAKLLKAGVEGFSVDANENTVQILGNSNMAVGHGVFSYLESLGYRYYFANPDWHIIPSRPDLFRKWNIVSAPAFNHRRIFYGYGTGSTVADADFNFWFLANKMGGSMNAFFGHSYEEIALRNKEIFLQHPEWFYPVAPKGIIPENAKFDMSKEDLIQFLIQDVEKRIETSLKNKTNDYKMISLGPSDGMGACNTPACQQLGTITDRVYYLTNRVAKAIQKKYPMTLIGCMAYSEYTPPPTKKVEPNVFVAITTAFSASKYSVEQLTEEWRKKGAIVGIYDYFSWYAWDYDIPGQSGASTFSKITKRIKKFYDKGVRAYEGESSIGWVSKGLGYYLSAKQMWDINADPVAAKKEFFRLCFGKATDVMEKLLNEWDNYSYTIVREGDLARWIDNTTEAERIEKDEKVKKRLFQVKSYLHWLFLYRIYELDKTEANLLPLLSYGYRKLDDGSVAGYPAFTVLGVRSGIPGMGFEENAKWKNNNRPVTTEEMNQWMREDRGKLKMREPVKEFLPTTKFKNVPGLDRYKEMIADTIPNEDGYWFTNEWVIEIKNKGAANYIDFSGNYVADPNNTKPIKISVYPFTVNGDVTGLPVLIYYEYTATKVKERISMAKLNPGYYTMIIEDPIKISLVNFSPSINYSIVMRPWRQITTTVSYYTFMYVPVGTKNFTVIKTQNLGFITPTGRKVTFADNKPEDVQVEVQKGEEGLWRIKPIIGKLFIEGIPPYLSTSPRQMLIPANVK